jgi:predicted solute-binding protein
MKIFFPLNIYARLIADSLPAQIKDNILFLPSAVLTSQLIDSKESVGLIPSLDIISHSELFISKDFGLSFEGSLCNSYFYFSSSDRQLNEINLYGDISSVEVLMSKILFRELYDMEMEVKILTDESKIKDQNLLIAGDYNFSGQNYERGISFAEEFIDTLSIPFVNYVFASVDKSSIESINEHLKDKSANIYSNVDNDRFGENLAGKLKTYIKENISSFVLDLDNQDIEGLNQTLRLPYYYGMIKDIIEVNYA